MNKYIFSWPFVKKLYFILKCQLIIFASIHDGDRGN